MINPPNEKSSSSKPGRHSVLVNGSRLKDFRNQRGLTQDEAAKAIGYSTRLIRKAERNGPLDPRTLRDFAEFFSTETAPIDYQELAVQAIDDEPELAVREFFHRSFIEQDMTVIDEYFAPDVLHVSDGIERKGIEVIHQRIQTILSSFSEMEFTVNHLVVQEPWRICNWSSNAVHTAEFMGIAATDNQITINGTSWFRFEQGKCVELRDYTEMQGLLNQLLGKPTEPL
ncbi:MAG: ester cyclase [Pirellulales bacterium]|jgi:transcriptional regulator with XRE-family HTH domain